MRNVSKCKGCVRVRGSQCHCARCHQTFPSLTAFDAHQNVNYRRKEPVICRDPEAMGMVLDSRHVWRTPGGIISSALKSSRLNTARRRKK